MNHSVALLNEIYRHAKTKEGKLIPFITDSEDIPFKKIISEYKVSFEHIDKLSDSMLASMNEEEKENSPFSKLNTYLTAKVSIITNNSVYHVATIIVEDNKESIDAMKQKIHEYHDAKKEVIDLANRLIEIEEQQNDELKKYL